MQSRPVLCVVDDDLEMRRALCKALEPVAAEIRAFSGAAQLLQDREALARAGCIVLKSSLAGVSGLDLQDSLRMIGNHAPLVFVSGPCEVGLAVRALRAGALDFLLMPLDAGTLRQRVSEALVRSSRAEARRMRVSQVAETMSRLTPREREVLDHVMSGSSNADMAEALGISTKTVEQHRARVMAKMRAGSLAQLVACVTEWRVVSELA